MRRKPIKKKNSTGQDARSFLRLAGVVVGSKDLSQRKGFTRLNAQKRVAKALIPHGL